MEKGGPRREDRERTVVDGLPKNDAFPQEALRRTQTRPAGTGGAVKDGTIERCRAS
jgi:translation initiation factor 1 (eIF-1/SUI1)